MSAFTPFWQRVGVALREGVAVARSGISPARGEPELRGGAVRPIEPAMITRADPRLSEDAGVGGGFPWPWKRREREMSRRYARLVELMDAIRLHVETRERQSELLNSSVARLAGTMEQLCTTQKAQAESLVSLARHVETTSRHAGALSTTLTELPAAMQAQAEAVHSVARRLDAAQGIDLQLTDSLDKMAGAVDTLRGANEAHTASLHRLGAGEAAHREHLAAFLREQARRVMVLTCVVGVLAILALGLAATVLLTRVL